MRRGRTAEGSRSGSVGGDVRLDSPRGVRNRKKDLDLDLISLAGLLS